MSLKRGKRGSRTNDKHRNKDSRETEIKKPYFDIDAQFGEVIALWCYQCTMSVYNNEKTIFVISCSFWMKSFCDDPRPSECFLISLSTCSCQNFLVFSLKAQQYNNFIGRKEKIPTVYKTNIYIYQLLHNYFDQPFIQKPIFHWISQNRRRFRERYDLFVRM